MTYRLAEWRLALRNLKRNKRRNVMTLLAVAFGYTGLALMAAYIVRSEHYLATNTVYINGTGHVAIYKPDALDRYLSRPAAYGISGDEQALIRGVLSRMLEVERVGGYLSGVGLVSNGCVSSPFAATGVEPAIDSWVRSHPEVRRWTPELRTLPRGRPIGEASRDALDAITITKPLAMRLGKPSALLPAGKIVDSGEPAPLVDCSDPTQRAALQSDPYLQLVARTHDGSFNAVDARAVGHHTTGLSLREGTGLVTSLSHLQSLYDSDSVTYLAVFLRPNATANDFVRKLKARFHDIGVEFEVVPFHDERVGQFYIGVLYFLVTMAAFFCALVLGMIVVTTVNFVSMAIRERRREIGTLRAVGYRREDVTRLFAYESTLLTLLGLGLGALVTGVAAGIVNQTGIQFTPPGIAGKMTFKLTLELLPCLTIALLIGAISALSALIALRLGMRDQIVTQLQG